MPGTAEFNTFLFKKALQCVMGQDSIVSIATSFGVDSLGFKPWWWQDFGLLSKLALEPTQLPVQWVLGHCPGVK
jgi:hypothetical protein